MCNDTSNTGYRQCQGCPEGGKAKWGNLPQAPPRKGPPTDCHICLPNTNYRWQVIASILQHGPPKFHCPRPPESYGWHWTVLAKIFQKEHHVSTVLQNTRRKLILPFHSTTHVNITLKNQEHHRFHWWFHHNFRLLSVPNKMPDLPKKKTFLNGMCPIHLKILVTANRSWSIMIMNIRLLDFYYSKKDN
jgi:hypothetical protein